MNGELAQSLALATHVTMWLAASPGDGSRSEASFSVPQFADLAAFDSVVGFETWAERLAADGVDRLWFAVVAPDTAVGLPDPVSAAFVGGLPVGLLSTGSGGSQLWRPRWSAATRVADGAQIMTVNYLPQPTQDGPARVGIDVAARELDQALARAALFADRQNLPAWAGVFGEARRQPAVEDGLFPASWPDPAGPRLAGMAQAAWVFGGMGSWNDLGFADGASQQEYEHVSLRLLETVLQACAAAVNVDLA